MDLYTKIVTSTLDIFLFWYAQVQNFIYITYLIRFLYNVSSKQKDIFMQVNQ